MDDMRRVDRRMYMAGRVSRFSKGKGREAYY
jgi:hypothetical protein